MQTKHKSPSALGQSERIDRAIDLGQNQIKYIPKEPNPQVEKGPNAGGSLTSTASTGGVGEKSRKRTGAGNEPPVDKAQMNTISISENSKPTPQLSEE